MARSRVGRVLQVLLLLVFGGCSPNLVSTPLPVSPPGVAATPAIPTAEPTPGTPGLSWARAADVERPAAAFTDDPSSPTTPVGPNTAGHPGHFPGQAIVDDVAATPVGLTAVGYVGVRGIWTAIAWTSSDGATWELTQIDATEGSLAVTIAAGGTGAGAGLIVAGGHAGREPAVWTSRDGQTWTRGAVDRLGGGVAAERIVTVIASDDGFLAGGSVGPELGERHARFWSSADGIHWRPLADSAAFADAEVVSIARFGEGYVALGRVGTGQRATASIAWTSADGLTWQPAAAPELGRGLVAATAELPDGSLVAVGSDLDEREALAWRSTDGSSWSLAPSEPSRRYNDGDKIRMTDVTAVPGGVVGVGNYVGMQFGTATSWTSDDGTTWQRAPASPGLEGSEILAVATVPDQLIAVGSYGAPDNYIPTIWRGPLPGG